MNVLLGVICFVAGVYVMVLATKQMQRVIEMDVEKLPLIAATMLIAGWPLIVGLALSLCFCGVMYAVGAINLC